MTYELIEGKKFELKKIVTSRAMKAITSSGLIKVDQTPQGYLDSVCNLLSDDEKLKDLVYGIFEIEGEIDITKVNVIEVKDAVEVFFAKLQGQSKESTS